MPPAPLLEQARREIVSPATRVVSFDVFDTLLCRTAMAPTDIFHIVERRACEEAGWRAFPFVEARREMEALTRERKRAERPDHEDVSFDEIYETFRHEMRLSDEDVACLKRIELEVEQDYLHPRRAIRELYDLAVASGKRVVAASDVYMPGRFVADTLRRSGYDVDRVYVSSDLRKSKGRGGMFPLMVADLGVKPAEIVHIGDNYRADFDFARKAGLRAIHIPKASDIFMDHSVSFDPWERRTLERAEPGVRMMLGSVANDVFDLHAGKEWTRGSLFDGSPYILGYYALGPLLLQLTQWFMQKAIRDRSDLAALIARDGHLIMKVYDVLRPFYPEAPPAEYVRTSRSVCYLFDIDTPADILVNHQKLHIDRGMTAREIIAQRFRVDPSGAFVAHLAEGGYALDKPVGDFAKFFRQCLPFADELLDGIRAERAKAQRYYEGQLGGHERIALFDVGYSGRAQRVFSTFLDAEIRGYYLFSFDKILELDRYGLSYENFLSAPTNRWLKDIGLSTGLVEVLISEHEVGSIVGFDETPEGLKPRLEASGASADARRKINEVQAGALDFARTFIARHGKDLRHMPVSPPSAMHILNRFMNAPLAPDARIFEGMEFSNGITGQVFRIIDTTEDASHWKEGFRALRAATPAEARRPAAPALPQRGSYRYGLLGWRRLYSPVVRRYVAKLGNAHDVRAFDENPKRFFDGLTSPKYRRIGRLLFP